MSDDVKNVETKAPASDEAKDDKKTIEEKPEKPEGNPEITQEYVKELRAENKKWRLKAKENLSVSEKTEERLKAAEEQSTEAMTLLKDFRSESDKRTIDAEIKLVCVQYGLKKKEYLKLADKSKIIINDENDVEGVVEMIDALKKDEPSFFELPSTGRILERPTAGEKTGAAPAIASMNRKDARKALDAFIRGAH